MKQIIVATDFSTSAANAFRYACEFARDYKANILLTHIYTMPVSYAGEGLSVVTMSDVLGAEEQMLTDELGKARKNYTGINIEAKVMIGDFVASLQQLRSDVKADLIIIGAIETQSGLPLWEDSDWLDALITVSCPVLVIPAHFAYRPLKNIAFACDYKGICAPEQIGVIKEITTQSGADLYIVNVTTKPGQEESKNAASYKKMFADATAHYHTVENKLVVRGLVEFVSEHHIDLLFVMPHRHGFWYKLFNKSHTRQLALLNHLPVMAIHEGLVI